jgi:hypothetical protein
MPRLLYPQGKMFQYLMERKLGGPQSWYRYCGENKNLLLLLRIKP